LAAAARVDSKWNLSSGSDAVRGGGEGEEGEEGEERGPRGFFLAGGVVVVADLGVSDGSDSFSLRFLISTP